MSFLSTVSWLSLLRVPQHGLPTLSRGRSAAAAPDRGQLAQMLRQAPAASLAVTSFCPCSRLGGVNPGRVATVAPNRRLRSLDLALVNCPKPGWRPNITLLYTENVILLCLCRAS